MFDYREKELLIILVCLVIIYLIYESQRKCESGTKRTGIDSTLANKAVGKAIDLGLNKLFK